MPKPFSLQSPEDIAKEYGGNKQKIAQAMQMGVVDPTAGTLAGMFIDRMRGAQMQEMAQTPTVAQQVFAPPAPPIGAPPMGAPPAPPMGAPPAPPMGAPPAPPMGAPPMGGMPPAPPMGAPPAPPMGMAEGGIAALPVPDMMFDEPMDGSYAGGGIVAFAEAGPVDYNKILQDQMKYYSDPQNYMRDVEAAYKPERKYAKQAAEFNEGILSPEGQKKRASEDKWFALAQLGATMASTPGSLLQAAGAGIQSALPGLRDATKERRAEVRDALKQLVADENMTNAEKRAFVIEGMKGKGEAGKIAEGFAQRASAKELALMQEAGATKRTAMQVGAQDRATAASKAAKAPDFMQQAVASRFAALKQVNDRKSIFPGGRTFTEADAKKYRITDEALLDRAFKEIFPMRYSSEPDPLKQAKAALMGQAFGGGQGGSGVVDLGAIEPPQR